MTMRTVFKSPAAIKLVTFNWSKWLDGATIVSSTFDVPGGLTKTQESATASQAKVFLSGGVLNQVYTVINRITDSLGRVEERSFQVSVIQT